MEDVFKRQFAEELALMFCSTYKNNPKMALKIIGEAFYHHIEQPKDKKHGDYSMNTYWLTSIVEEDAITIAKKTQYTIKFHAIR
jgi:hypothetical protein